MFFDDYDVKNLPELMPYLLKRVPEEITACSGENSVPVENLRQVFLKSCNQLIDNMWENENVHEKILNLRKLQSEFPPDLQAWRPITGTTPIPTLIGKQLLEKKQALERNLAEKRENAKQLRAILEEKRKKVDLLIKQVDDLDYNEDFETFSRL